MVGSNWDVKMVSEEVVWQHMSVMGGMARHVTTCHQCDETHDIKNIKEETKWGKNLRYQPKWLTSFS